MQFNIPSQIIYQVLELISVQNIRLDATMGPILGSNPMSISICVHHGHSRIIFAIVIANIMVFHLSQQNIFSLSIDMENNPNV